MILVSDYLFMSFNNNEDIYNPVLVSSVKCTLDGEVYHYYLYKEEYGTYSFLMDEYDKMPSNVINYKSEEKWFDSIEKYYEEKGGMCP